MRLTFNELDTISRVSFHLHDDDQGTLKALKTKMSELGTQLSVLEKLEPTTRLIHHKKQLPVRKLSFNIRKLSESNLKTASNGESRWTRLQNLECETAVFCMIAFSGLAILAGDEFEWLLENMQRYLAIQSLPCGWIASEQIRQVMARALRQSNTIPFLESKSPFEPYHIFNINMNLGYHKLEFQICDSKENDTSEDEATTKRIHIEHPGEKSCEVELETCSSPRMENEHRTPPPNSERRGEMTQVQLYT